jgi:anti-sigma regulatory factor (Ser/Thr protein kinase)
MSYSIINLSIEYEHDVVLARQRAREIAALLGFDNQDQTRVATAVSELARNAFVYAGRD